jgi:hypothetical protein
MFQNSALPSVSVDITQTIAGSLPRLRAWQGLARLDQLLPLPRTFREYFVWLLMMAGVAALALLQISVTLQISQTQAEANLLQRQYVLLEQKNAQLLWEISHFTTLERVQSEAVAAGFVPTLQRRYVAAEPSTAVTPAVNTEAVATVAAAQSQPETISVVVAGEPGASVMNETSLATLWDDLTEVWAEKTQSLSSQADRLRDSLSQQWLKIDLSRYLWIGNPPR